MCSTLLTRTKVLLPKGGEIRDTKTLNFSRDIVSLQVSHFSPCVINLSRNKNICCRLKKVVAKSRARVYFERQSLALLLVFHQTLNLSRNNFARALANQPISALHFFNPQQMFLLYLQTQIRFLIGGERVTCHWSKLSDALGRTKLNDAIGKQQPELWTRT